MLWTRRSLIRTAGAPAAGRAGIADVDIVIQPGPFGTEGSSLERDSCPEWFRDAKFGIRAHWGRQPAASAGDRYARNMYIYDRGARYKSPRAVIDLLVAINGSLLLGFPLPGTGALDDAELKILAAITGWMRVNSEAIDATRPWKIFGEGPGIRKTAPGGGSEGAAEHFNEKNRIDLTAEDMRFTTQGDTLFGFSMGWNPRETVVGALAPSRRLRTQAIRQVDLLGSDAPLRWKLSENGLHIESPRTRPYDYSVVLRVLCE